MSTETFTPVLESAEDEYDYAAAADDAADRLVGLTAEVADYSDQLKRLGVVETELEEIPTYGPHKLLVLDETVQPSNAFKYNGAAYAVTRLAENSEIETAYAASAGNWGAATAIAARRADLDAVVYLPQDYSPVKKAAIDEQGAATDVSSVDVASALKAAQRAADADPHGKFLHAYDDEHGVAGQGLVANRLVAGLHQRQAEGQLNLHHDPVDILVQRGGGSLLGGVAAAVMAEKLARRMGDNVRVLEVRPELNQDGSLNKVFDGLAVESPGELTAPIIQDERYVSHTIHVTEQAAGRAALRLEVARDKTYEPSGLAGVAAYEQLAPRNLGPATTYVTVLSGANVSPERYDYLADKAENFNRAATSIASAPTHSYARGGPVEPIPR